MTIDTILNPHTPSKTELQAALKMTFAVAEAIREAGEVSSGTVYAILIGRVSFEGYQGLLRNLKNAGLVEETPANMLRWIGPALEARR